MGLVESRYYIPDGYDASDPRYTYLGESKHKNDTRAANLLTAVPEAFKTDPAPTGSYALDAVTAATRFLALRTNNSKLPARPSRRFLYYNSRALALIDQEGKDPHQWPDEVKDEGVTIRHATRAVSVFGAATEDSWPWVEQQLRGGKLRVVLGINDRPFDAAYTEAAAGPAIECNRVDAIPPGANLEGMERDELKALGLVTLSSVKKCLTEGYPVIFAFCFFWDTFQSVPPSITGADEGHPSIAMIPVERRLAGPDPTKGLDTHVALIVGFDQERRRVLVKCFWQGQGQSSLSPPPYFWMSYEWITDVRATKDFWMMRESTKSARRAMNKPNDFDFFDLQGKPRSQELERPSTIKAPTLIPTSTIINSWHIFKPLPFIPITMLEIHSIWTGGDGSVEGARVNRQYVDDSRNMTETRSTYTIRGPGSAASGGLAAGSQGLRMVIFWVGKDGSVQLAYGGAFQIDVKWEYAVVAPAGSAQPTAGLAATIQSWGGHDRGHIYWVGPHGSIEVASTVTSIDKWEYRQVAGPGSATPLSNIAAISSKFDFAGEAGINGVWWISPDGMVRGASGNNSIDWTQQEAKLEPLTAALCSRLAVVPFPEEGHIRVLYVSPDGTIRARRYTDTVNDTQAYGGSRARTDTAIHMTSTEAMWVSPNNSLMMGNKDGNSARALSKPGCVMAGSPISLIYSGSDSFMASFVGYDGRLAMTTG